MEDSILTTIKKLLGITEDYEHFDLDIIVHINSVLMALRQMGVGPKEGLVISDSTAVWSDFTNDSTLLESVKTYIYMRVRLMFDTPTNSATVTAFNECIREFEWRLWDQANYAESFMED